LQPVANTRGLNIIIDYAHTPDAVERILCDLLPLTTGRLITVIGAGGERDAAKRIPMGKAAAQHSSVVVITDDNPRSEEPGEIRASLRAGALQVNETHVEEVPNRADAIRMALESAEPGDTVAVLGKGAEEYQEIGSVRVPFSDEATIRTVLREMT
jgi:UDP-N-acetylmuramoyl-L-alanyl-D-glutamate--2,6-diaminopimelate ligase